MGEMLTTGDVGRALGVSINTVKSWIRAGRLRAIRLPSGHYRVPRTELDRLRRSGIHDAGSGWRERRRQWRRAEEWERSQPVEETSLEQALGWVASMLDIATSRVPLPEPSVEEKVRRVRRLHLGLASVGR